MRPIIGSILAVAACLASTHCLADEPKAETKIDFNEQIATIFKKYCLGCHNASDAEHGLVLESYDALLKGGDDGAVLVAGQSGESRLTLMLEGKAKPAMPPEGNEPPTTEEVAILKRWIDAGAKGPKGAVPDRTALVTPKVKPTSAARKAINAAAWSPDGKLLALAYYGEVRLVSPETRETIRALADHRGNVTDVQFSSDGKRLVTASGEAGLFGEARLCNVDDGALVRAIVGHKDSLYCAALSPDGKLIATGSYDQQIKLWNADTGEELRTIAGHNGAVFDLAFSPDGARLASASADRSVKLWDVATGARLDTFGQPLKEQYAVAFSPDGRRVIAGGVDNRIRVWTLSESAREGTNTLTYTRFAHEGPIVRLAFAPDGKLLASAAEDRTVKLWDPREYTELRVLEKQSDWATALALSSDNKSLVVGRADGSLAFYDATSGKLIPPPKPELSSLEPRGVRRGQTTRVKLQGKHLRGVNQVRSANADLNSKLLSSEPAKADELWIEVTPKADLARGPYRVAVTSPDGESGELTLYVDELPQVVEVEAGNAPQAIALPTGAWGTIGARGDVDHFAFDVAAGQTIVFDLAAKSLQSELDGVLTLLSPTGQVVATSNDDGSDPDPLLAYTAPSAGRYTVRVADQSAAGSPKHVYRLTLGELPLVTGCFPLSVPRDQGGEVRLTGYHLPADARATVPPGKGNEAAAPLDASFRSRRPVSVLLVDAREAVEAEPNDAHAQATLLAAPATVQGRIEARTPSEAADADWYRFECGAGETWIIEVDAARRGSLVDSKVEVFDHQGNPVPRVLLQAVRDSYVEFRPITSENGGLRAKNWEEMELNEYMYMQGEVCKIFRMPRGPDSEVMFYLSGGRRRGYFDTSAASHALDESVYIVEPHPPGTELVPTGLPVFTVYYVNDDDGDRRLGRDSRLTFTAPGTGAYYVRVTDARGFAGDRFAYRLSVRRPRPDFRVRVEENSVTVPAGSGRRLNFNVERLDGFGGEIAIEATGLPSGFTLSAPTTIEAGHTEAQAVLRAAADAPEPGADARSALKLVAKARVGDETIAKDVTGLAEIKRGQPPRFAVRMEPAEVTIAPGTTVSATLKVDRGKFDERIQFDVDNLPHGVIVDNIGLNGVLIPEGQSERQIFLSAAKWVPDSSRPIYAVSQTDGEASPAITLHVRRPAAVAEAVGK